MAPMSRFFPSKLYVRIWLAVVAAVVVLTFAVGTAWRLTQEPTQLPIRELQIKDAAGVVVGKAQTKPGRKPADGLEFDVVTQDGQSLNIYLPRPQRPLQNTWGKPWGQLPFGFGWMLALVAVAVALGSYPVIRRLTQRLEALQSGVERWGAGDLSSRLTVQGNDEVAFLAKRFNHAAEQIEALLHAHKSLLANASHELRSPLARIQMGLELSSLAQSSPERQEISRSITELDQLIDEILLASRLDAKDVKAEPFESVDLTGLAAEECARAKAELGLSATGQSLVLPGSPRLLRRLIRNLLENARRYSTGEVELDLTLVGSGTEPRAVITVSDRGPGVPADQRERIFEPFYRLPGSSERSGGVGLGLALVKSISLQHGGGVRCEARAGGGARFVVELPF